MNGKEATVVHVSRRLLKLKQDKKTRLLHTVRQHQARSTRFYTCRNVLYSSLSKPPSAILILSSSSSCCAIDDRSTGVKYSPCSRLFRQCCAHREPSCWKRSTLLYNIFSDARRNQTTQIFFLPTADET